MNYFPPLCESDLITIGKRNAIHIIHPSPKGKKIIAKTVALNKFGEQDDQLAKILQTPRNRSKDTPTLRMTVPI